MGVVVGTEQLIARRGVISVLTIAAIYHISVGEEIAVCSCPMIIPGLVSDGISTAGEIRSLALNYSRTFRCSQLATAVDSQDEEDGAIEEDDNAGDDGPSPSKRSRDSMDGSVRTKVGMGVL